MSPIKGIKQDLQRVNKLIDRADELVSERNQIAQGLNAFYAHCWDAGEWVALEDLDGDQRGLPHCAGIRPDPQRTRVHPGRVPVAHKAPATLPVV